MWPQKSVSCSPERPWNRQDLVAAVKFLVLAVVVLPLLPDQDLGPFGALNPRKIGILVVIIAGISFVGYVAIRILGPQRGLGLTGLIGGLASSTAVTLSMSSRARKEPALGDSLALAVSLSSSIMFVRMGILVTIAAPGLLRLAWLPLAAMAAAGREARPGRGPAGGGGHQHLPGGSFEHGGQGRARDPPRGLGLRPARRRGLRGDPRHGRGRGAALGPLIAGMCGGSAQ
jgi:hypothetical protein